MFVDRNMHIFYFICVLVTEYEHSKKMCKCKLSADWRAGPKLQCTLSYFNPQLMWTHVNFKWHRKWTRKSHFVNVLANGVLSVKSCAKMFASNDVANIRGKDCTIIDVSSTSEKSVVSWKESIRRIIIQPFEGSHS